MSAALPAGTPSPSGFRFALRETARRRPCPGCFDTSGRGPCGTCSARNYPPFHRPRDRRRRLGLLPVQSRARWRNAIRRTDSIPATPDPPGTADATETRAFRPLCPVAGRRCACGRDARVRQDAPLPGCGAPGPTTGPGSGSAGPGIIRARAPRPGRGSVSRSPPPRARRRCGPSPRDPRWCARP